MTFANHSKISISNSYKIISISDAIYGNLYYTKNKHLRLTLSIYKFIKINCYLL